MARAGRGRCRLRKVHGGQMRHEKEEHGVGGNVQIEIHKAVGEEAAAGDETGELQGSDEGIVGLAQAL